MWKTLCPFGCNRETDPQGSQGCQNISNPKTPIQLFNVEKSFVHNSRSETRVGCFQKIGFSPKMDGEINGKHPIKMDDLGGIPIFGNIQLCGVDTHNSNSLPNHHLFRESHMSHGRLENNHRPPKQNPLHTSIILNVQRKKNCRKMQRSSWRHRHSY